jgi:dienelactone hydrolase
MDPSPLARFGYTGAMRIGRFAATLLVVAAVLAGCSHRQVTLRITADPPTGLYDAPLTVRVTGAQAGQRVRLDASATDRQGRVFSSNATFVADTGGTVDVTSAAPVTGSYTGAHATGLLWSMAPTGTSDFYFAPAATTMTVTLTARVDGAPAVSAQIDRLRQAPGVTQRPLTLALDGIDGVMFEPADTTTPRPAVLVFGGSEGGLSTSDSVMLASAGYPALAISYFGDPGQPANLVDIPLEYFATALRWLSRQPGVDPARVAVFGTSRGSEAALLLGAYYPDLVHAVVASVPSYVVVGSLPTGDKSAWTLHGTEFPFVPFNSRAAYHPEAVIPVERIRGPLFLLCGGSDQLWPSCPSSHEIAARRAANHTPYSDVLAEEPGAGHFVGSPVPNVPASSAYIVSPRYGSETVGGTQQADALGRLDAWPRLLQFLAGLRAGT